MYCIVHKIDQYPFINTCLIYHHVTVHVFSALPSKVQQLLRYRILASVLAMKRSFSTSYFLF